MRAGGPGAGLIRRSGIYAGETYDARLEPAGWSNPGFDHTGWSGVQAAAAPTARLVAPSGPPVRRIEEVREINLRTSPTGRTIVDFGQNLVGWAHRRPDRRGL